MELNKTKYDINENSRHNIVTEYNDNENAGVEAL